MGLQTHHSLKMSEIHTRRERMKAHEEDFHKKQRVLGRKIGDLEEAQKNTKRRQIFLRTQARENSFDIRGQIFFDLGEIHRRIMEIAEDLADFQERHGWRIRRNMTCLNFMAEVKDKLAHAWADLRHEAHKTLVVTKLAFSSTEWDPCGEHLFRNEEKEIEILKAEGLLKCTCAKPSDFPPCP